MAEFLRCTQNVTKKEPIPDEKGIVMPKKLTALRKNSLINLINELMDWRILPLNFFAKEQERTAKHFLQAQQGAKNVSNANRL